jgi:hypothetical protein
MINFISNDPLAPAHQPREVAARPDRKPELAGFLVTGNEPEAVYPVGTPGFLRWQSRQAAILAVEAWEEALDAPITSWAAALDDPSTIVLVPDAGTDLNAFYDRASLSFFHRSGSGRTVFSGASTDVVAHETGHALLDALRPDLWDTSFLEVGGAHEAFGDITALLTALADKSTRQDLLGLVPDLGTAHFVEATAEDLSDGVRLFIGAMHPASKPRRALNTFSWQLPETMSRQGGPDDMIAEVHSIARILTGCFYDVLRALYREQEQTENGLWEATRIAARLAWSGFANAPEVPRFFRAVGRQMALAAGTQSEEMSRLVSKAFTRHGVALGASALLAPELALAGDAPQFNRSTAVADVQDATIDDLRRRLGTGSAPVDVSMVRVDNTSVAKVSFHVDVALDDVDPRLAGVVCPTNVPALVGESGHSAALLHAPRQDVATEETQQFVRVLIANDQLAFDQESPRGPTHVVGQRDEGTRELRRVGFSC